MVVGWQWGGTAMARGWHCDGTAMALRWRCDGTAMYIVLRYSNAPAPEDIYIKGEVSDTSSTVFGKFRSTSDRDAVKKVMAASLEFDGQKVWATIDQPLERRLLQAVLFATKRLLTDRRFSQKSLWVELDKATLFLKGELMMCVASSPSQVDIDFVEGCNEYLHTDNDEFATILSDARGKRSRKVSQTGKRNGKKTNPRKHPNRDNTRHALGFTVLRQR